MRGFKHEVTKTTKRQVEMMSGFGLRHLDIARILEISVSSLENKYKKELQRGHAISVATVAQALYKQAINGNTTAQIFYLKTRGRWSEVQKHELSGPDGQALPPGVQQRGVVQILVTDGKRHDPENKTLTAPKATRSIPDDSD